MTRGGFADFLHERWRGRVSSVKRRLLRMSPLLPLALLFAATTTQAAETLLDALSAAYRTNPVLQGQRDDQKALDETYVQAKAGWRPTAGLTTEAQYDRGPNSVAYFSQGFSGYNFGAAAVTVTQPLYTGGRTTWAVRAADATVRAGREALRGVEAQVLLSAIQGYVDVLRDQQILAIRDADMATLERQVAESEAKFTLGQVTRTDVADAQASLEAARGALAAATGQMEFSRAEFEAAVGHAPDRLADPADLPGLPATLDEAMTLAETASPQLQQSRLRERSSRAAIAEAKAAWRPTVSLQGAYGFIGPVSPWNVRDYGQEATAGVTVTLPLLTGGVTASQVRQASAQNGSDQIAIETVRRQVVQTIVQAWSQLQANRLGVRAAQAQETAASLALKGTQAEYGYGLRKTLDVLIADQALRAAQQSLAVSRHDAFLAQAALLSASGGLEARNLIPGEPLYDANANFDRVKHSADLPWQGAVEALDKIGAP
jgi:outer membrane protein